MKTKQMINFIVAISFVALGSTTWAAGHDGGGGFGSRGHVAGGAIHNGGLSVGPVTGGVGSRGGGVGFGGMRVPGRAPSFEGAGPRFSSSGHPSHEQPQLAATRGQLSRPAMAAQPDRRFAMLGNHIVSRHDANWHGDWDHRHAHFHNGRFFVFIGGFWCGLDAGFFPWDYLPYYPNDYYPYDYYTDIDPYDYNGTNYNVDPADSATIQAVQTQLGRLGYYNGSVDGVFGPSTRDAVARFQIANQLNVTGSLSADMLRSLNVTQASPS